MDGKTSPEQVSTAPTEVVAKSERPGISRRQKFLRMILAPLAAMGMTAGAATSVEAATPQQNMVAGTEKVLGDPGQKMAAGAELVRDSGSNMAQSQLDIQSEPAVQIAQDQEKYSIKDFAAGPEKVQDKGREISDATLDVREKGSDMANNQTDNLDTPPQNLVKGAEKIQDEDSGGSDSSGDSIGVPNSDTQPVLPPPDEAKV